MKNIKIHKTLSGRPISYYCSEFGGDIISTYYDTKITLDEFFEILLRSWVKESAYPR